MQPIWKDYFVDFSTLVEGQEYVDYVIKKGNEVIYHGRAYKTPGDLMDVRISDIVADYLGHISLRDLIASTLVVTTDLAAISSFSVYVNDEEQDEEVFFNCWDYKTTALPVQRNLSGTISKEYVDGMPIVRTTAVSNISTGIVINHYKTANAEYKQVQCCNPAALYFYNAQCGWDFLLCKGGAKRLHSYERNTMKREYDNAVNERGAVNYQNIESVTWDVYTGRLTNEGAANIGQLVGSCDVWLWTPESGLVPVVMRTNEAQELTYKNNGRKPVEYTLRVELAQDRQRR